LIDLGIRLLRPYSKSKLELEAAWTKIYQLIARLIRNFTST